ncbi:unnamed protein product [Mortierella alpina]
MDSLKGSKAVSGARVSRDGRPMGLQEFLATIGFYSASPTSLYKMADPADPAQPRPRPPRRYPVRVLRRMPPPTQYHEDEYEVESVLTHRWLPDGTIQYLVKWVGYPNSANTWQTEADLANAPDRLQEYKAAAGLE